jgi:maltose O-acetyltransferase
MRVAALALRWLRAKVALRSARTCGRLVFTNGPLQVHNRGLLHVGERVRFWSTIAPVQLRIGQGASLRIGHDCYINGAIIVATHHVHIADGVFVAPGCIIADTPNWRTGHSTGQAIHIADHAWLATRCIIMPGVRVGAHAVVGVGAVVTTDVPPYAIVAGVPAKIIRYLDTKSAHDASTQ